MEIESFPVGWHASQSYVASYETSADVAYIDTQSFGDSNWKCCHAHIDDESEAIVYSCEGEAANEDIWDGSEELVVGSGRLVLAGHHDDRNGWCPCILFLRGSAEALRLFKGKLAEGLYEQNDSDDDTRDDLDELDDYARYQFSYMFRHHRA